MKQFCAGALLISLILGACTSGAKKDDPTPNVGLEPQAAVSFFPVTNYIEGQIAEIRTYGLAPIKFDLSGGKRDSAWLKNEEIDSVFKPFLFPVIDSNNLITQYEETRFSDQTINAFTFTYTPIIENDSTLILKRWDVYINTKTNEVQRVFMVQRSGKKEIQLTWQHNEWCSIRTIATGANGSPMIEKEELIKWKYD
jgi:hypothetical protein